MKMKLKYLGISLLLLGSLSSCEKWFDITPNDQIKAEDEFASVDGFKDALSGVYISLGEKPLYGQDMTYNAMDLLSQQYRGLVNLGLYYNMQNFNYKHVRSELSIKNMWRGLYYSLANVNSALSHLESSTFAWNIAEKNIIKGELLGLRAFLHFELIRVFGHSGYALKPELASELAIPYQSKYSKEVAPQLSYTETFQLIEKDIQESLEALKYDPIATNSSLTSEQLSEINRDGFYNQRYKRFNYFAAKALLARVYAWQGGSKLAEAARIAEEVISTTDRHLLGTQTDPQRNRIFTSEVLFGLQVEGLSKIVNPFLDASSTTQYNALTYVPAVVESMYEIDEPEVGMADVRYAHLMVPDVIGYVSIKLRQESGGMDLESVNTIPLMKLPELYYIAAEYYKDHNLDKSIQLLNEVRRSRRIIQDLPNTLTAVQVQAELLKEYRKEFVSEGQLFFYFKRLGMKQIPNYSIEMDDVRYMLPYPAEEVEFGDRVQNYK